MIAIYEKVKSNWGDLSIIEVEPANTLPDLNDYNSVLYKSVSDKQDIKSIVLFDGSFVHLSSKSKLYVKKGNEVRPVLLEEIQDKPTLYSIPKKIGDKRVYQKIKHVVDYPNRIGCVKLTMLPNAEILMSNNILIKLEEWIN